MERRLELQRLLETILGSSNVYFQPPPSCRMNYPAIKYVRSDIAVKRADNQTYSYMKRYSVTLIGHDSDSPVVDKLISLPMCEYDRQIRAGNLYHDVFVLYF